MPESRKPTVGKQLRAILLELRSNPRAIQDLIDLMGDRFYKEAYKSLQDHGEAEDAVNLAFFKLWNKADFYSPDRPALPYALSVIRNYCRDVWRSRQKKPKPTSLYDNQEAYLLPDERLEV